MRRDSAVAVRLFFTTILFNTPTARTAASTRAATDEHERFVHITPKGDSSSTLLGEMRDIWAHRRVIAGLVQRQLRLRYKGSFLGIFWSVAPPVIQVAVLWVVIGCILGSGPPNLSAFMLCAYVPWTFMSNSLLDAASSVLEQGTLIKKAYFPREILPIAAVLSNLVHFCIGLLVFLIYRYVLTTALIAWPGLPPREVLLLPFIVLDMVMVSTGLALMVSAWTTFFEDVKYLTTVALQLLFYAMPIIYFSENIFYSSRGTPLGRKVVYNAYLLDPLAWIITAFKQIFFGKQIISPVGATPIRWSAPFDYRYFAIATLSSLIVLLIGLAEFRRLKWKFAERP